MRQQHRTARTGAPTLRQVVAEAGFRRVEEVRIVATGGGVVAQVTGVIHRLPQTVPVSIATARRLAAAGAPLHIDGPPARAVTS